MTAYVLAVRKSMLVAVIFGLALYVISAQQAAAGNTVPARLVVSSAGPYTTVQAALTDAHDGDVVEVRAGAYHGPVVVDKAVTLEGIGWPSLDNGEQGTVVRLVKSGAVVRGFEIKGSGVEPDQDHAGITMAAANTTAENNRLHDVLFGIFVAEAPGAIVRGNDVSSKPEYDLGRKGDGIRLWYSPRSIVENNTIHDTRDVVIWYSEDVQVIGNTIERGRYAIHFMFCNNVRVERNRILDNSVGIYTMYSDNVVMTDNLIRGQRGPSGYALGFKDSKDIDVSGNVLVDNRAGIFLDNTPYSDGFARVQNNVLAFNDVGATLLTDSKGGQFNGNTFWENTEQVSIQGGGKGGANVWQGNYWSDYNGFDTNGDGVGDLPYTAERVFENLVDRVPSLRALLYSPAVQAIEFAASAFPVIRPVPKFTDAVPQMQPAVLPEFARPAPGDGLGMGLVALVLLGLSIVFALDSRSLMRSGLRESKTVHADTPTHGGVVTNHSTEMTEPRVMLRVTNASKRYGKVDVLRGVSFQAAAGEALALWGPNGAGKTTLVKSILGLVDYRGDIQVDGHDVRRNGKQARRLIGYVPQEVTYNDWSVDATMRFYAALKKANPAQITPLLERMGLTSHARKGVPVLSGGLKQRLALAIALLGDPPILLLDEPMANLDTQVRAEYRSLLSGLRRDGKTILFASHRLEEIEMLADRVLILEQGILKAELTPEALRITASGQVKMTLWVPEKQRTQAAEWLTGAGMPAHMNGRGTVVAHINADQKARLMRELAGRGIEITDFEIEQAGTDR